jgi:hypothetical protein
MLPPRAALTDFDQREQLISMLEAVAANLGLAKGVHPGS